jgi:hypothetical protein
MASGFAEEARIAWILARLEVRAPQRDSAKIGFLGFKRSLDEMR